MTGSIPFPRPLTLSVLAGTVFLGITSCQPARKAWDRFPIETGESDLISLHQMDLNGDRISEIVVSRLSPPDLLILERRFDAQGKLSWIPTEHPVPGGAMKTLMWNPLIGETRKPFLIVLTGAPTSSAYLFPVLQLQNLGFQLGEPTRLALPPASWKEVAYGDLNNDGIEDLAFAAGVENPDLPSAPVVIWLSRKLDPTREPERVLLNIGEVGQALLLTSEDIDQDGDIDLKIVDGNTANASMGAYWLENPWPEQPGVAWKCRFITLSAAPPAQGQVADLDGDNREDLLLPFRIAEGTNRLVGFKKIVKGGQTGWLPLPYPISGKQGQIKQSLSSDVNLDGFPDMILGFDGAEAPLEHLFWMENPGNSATPKWIRRSIAGSDGSAIHNMLLCDVDQDGDLDVIALESNNKLVWYENPHFPLRD